MQAFKLKEDRFEHTAGTTVYPCKGYDYGLSSDDTRDTGTEHKSMTLSPTGDYPYFTCPVNILQSLNVRSENDDPQV